MSKKTDTLQDLPTIPELPRAKLNQLICADYLEYMAKMVRTGRMTGFDLAWTPDYEKPVGKLEVASFELTAPLEARIMGEIQKAQAEMAEAQERARAKIDVVDGSEHEKCDNDACVVCHSPFKA